MTTPTELRKLAEDLQYGTHPANVVAILREFADRDEKTASLAEEVHEERGVRALRLIEKWVSERHGILSGETPAMHQIAVELMDLFPRLGIINEPTIVIQRLANERNDREARRRMLEMALDTITYIPADQIVVESNPLYLGDGYNNGYSYLEQAQVLMPEVGPGEAEAIRNALAMLVQVANHRRRDELGDSERIAIGWPDLKEKAA